MANPSYFQITPCVENHEINFRLYLWHTSLGPGHHCSPPTAVINWDVHDGPGPDATVVARAQGLRIHAGNGNGNGNGNWHNTLSLVFEVERFKGSTLQVMGLSGEGEWAIVGGTGEFTRAAGVISKKQTNDGNITELAIHASCPLPKGPRSLVTKIGPWGGNGGTFQDITEAPLPRRLESITVCHRRLKVVNSIAFSYIDHAGQKRTAGPFGGSSGESHTIPLDRSECVKEVSGTFDKYKGSTVITSLKFVTDVKPTGYGPFGRIDEEGTRFTVPVLDSSVIVGFFGRGGEYLHAVGVYVHPF